LNSHSNSFAPASDERIDFLLPDILASQARRYVIHNDAMRILDGLVQLSVRGGAGTEPPTNLNDNDRFRVALARRVAGFAFAGRAAKRLDTLEHHDAIHRQMLDAAANRPRDRDAFIDRLRGGRF
jgi:hypothetical protein